MNKIQIEERAPRLRTEGDWIVRVLAATVAFLVIATMLAQMIGIAPKDFGTYDTGSWGYLTVLALAIALAVFLSLRLLPPFKHRVELTINPQDDLVTVLRGGKPVESIKLSEVRGLEVGPYPVPDGPIIDWVKPTGIWAIDSFVRKNALARCVFLLTGDENNKKQIEVAAFLARGDEGERLAQQAAKEIEEALEKARST